MRTAAIVLAAGKSERMKKNKLLLKLQGQTLITRILDALQVPEIDEIVVVLGHKPQEIMNEINRGQRHLKIVINERYEEGMSSSFIAGLRQTKGADSVFLILGDEPILDNALLGGMVKRMMTSDALIVSPSHKGKKGHPLLFNKKLFEEISNLTEGEVIRDVVHRHIDKLVTVDAPAWTIMDIDTPEDLSEMEKLLAHVQK
jgi:molybdenum cofactor cytidylyltransferase